MQKYLIATLIAVQLGITSPVSFAVASPSVAAPASYRPLPKPGERIPLDANHYFVYGFDKRPKLGMCTMKVEVFTRDGKRNTSFTILGNADMPSMRGAHATGDQPFSASAKGVYFLPVHLVMPGNWEIRFTFEKQGKVVLRGSHLFDL